MGPGSAIAFVRDHGIVLESAAGPVPSLAAAVAGAPFTGSWWSHPFAKQIFQVTRAVRDADEILVCRLLVGKITFVHRRLWPALARIGNQLEPLQVARLHERHTTSGRHVLDETPFPAWVPAEVLAEATLLDETAAWAALDACAPGLTRASSSN